MKIEYAISAGPGTLIDYGQAWCLDIDSEAVTVVDLNDRRTDFWHDEEGPLTVISAPCPDDCQTGQ